MDSSGIAENIAERIAKRIANGKIGKIMGRIGGRIGGNGRVVSNLAVFLGHFWGAEGSLVRCVSKWGFWHICNTSAF